MGAFFPTLPYVFYIFLRFDLNENSVPITVYGRVRQISECSKSILNCVPKMNGSLTGLERHEGE